MLLGGKTVFPITLANGPPLTGKDPVTGGNGWAEVASSGVKMLRIYPDWNVSDPTIRAQQIQSAKAELVAAASHGLRLWVGLHNVVNDLSKQASLEQIVDALKGSPGLGAWKGADEPLHGNVPAPGLVSVYDCINSRDPNHPVVLIEAPRARTGPLTAALLRPYAKAADIHGVDIYPISHPPGTHAGRRNKDISVVGDVMAILVQATPGKDHWTTLQIAWSGVLPPAHVPIFPTLHQQRFMAYQAIVAGARGLVFFGGDLTEVMSPQDKAAGWNWTYWHTVLKHVVQELSSTAVGPILTAPTVTVPVKPDATDIQIAAREANGFLHLVTVRRSPTANGPVRFSGLPSGISEGQVLFEYDQADFRTVEVARGVFTDPFAPHDAHVYRFPLPV
jgi:hypothetical protein